MDVYRAQRRLFGTTVFAALALGGLCLTGCSATSSPPSSTPTPGASSEPSPSSNPASLPELPTCDTIFTADGFALAAAEGLTPNGELPGSESEGGGFARFDASLRPILDAAEGISCSFVLPATERGMIVTVARISVADRSAVETFLSTSGYATSPTAPPVYSLEHGGEYPFTEAHVLDGGLWSSSFDYFGSAASSYALDALVQSLGPVGP